ncbi:hypothetical protein B0H66DRAFT_605319 [Apodospora peruviana]|uniref:Uncharacterized protein n=1 Tax=Apodospora peruviana TaxID=516989 RepID=A0AAE0M367_9PEZI|nr:hypothetical protein B0H66DRAFT_605319 [Apodospora peruviana]
MPNRRQEAQDCLILGHANPAEDSHSKEHGFHSNADHHISVWCWKQQPKWQVPVVLASFWLWGFLDRKISARYAAQYKPAPIQPNPKLTPSRDVSVLSCVLDPPANFSQQRAPSPATGPPNRNSTPPPNSGGPYSVRRFSYRASLLQRDDFYDQFMNDIWHGPFGQKTRLDSGDDTFSSRWVLKHGYTNAVQQMTATDVFRVPKRSGRA